MIQLMVAVEGNTERNFIKHVLGPHPLDRQVYVLEPTIVGKLHAQRRGSQKRGGGPFRFWREDLERILRGDGRHDLRVTTLFDLYGLPRDFPGLDEHRTDTNTNRRCDALQAKLAEQFDDRRFIPYLQRHEFEALVLASLSGAAAFWGEPVAGQIFSPTANPTLLSTQTPIPTLTPTPIPSRIFTSTQILSATADSTSSPSPTASR